MSMNNVVAGYSLCCLSLKNNLGGGVVYIYNYR